MHVRYQAALRPDWVKIIPERLRKLAGFTAKFFTHAQSPNGLLQGQLQGARVVGLGEGHVAFQQDVEFLARAIDVAGFF